jgi:signal transduction histidine kinase
LSIVSFQNATQLTQNNSQVEQGYVVLNLLNDIETSLLDAESARQGYFLSKDPVERTRCQNAIPVLRSKIVGLKQAPAQSETRQTIGQLDQQVDRWLAVFQQSIEAFDRQQIELPSDHPLPIEMRQARQSIDQLLEELHLQQQRSMQIQRAEAQSTLRSRLQIEGLGNVLTFFILLGVYFILRRQKFRRQTAEAGQRWMAQQNEMNELKLQFFSMLSHEFRTPLSLITGSAQLLKDSLKPIVENNQLKNLVRIQSSAKLMNQQLNDLLMVARADAGKLEFTPVSLEMQSFCLNLVEDFQSFGGTPRLIQFSKRGKSTHAMVDEKLLYSILSNLLSNALKYSEPQSTVHFMMICEPYAVTFEIRDEGVGISSEDQQSLYSLFSRGKNVQETTGSGLGLAVVKRCVELHQGKIVVESKMGVGTKVTVKLSNLGYLN